MRIKGTVSYQSFEGGFWGIESENGQQYRPINMPEQLKSSGAQVEIVAIEADVMSFIMWGTPVRIISFSTLMP